MEIQRQEVSKARHNDMLSTIKKIEERKLAVVAQMAANHKSSLVLHSKKMKKRRRKSFIG